MGAIGASGTAGGMGVTVVARRRVVVRRVAGLRVVAVAFFGVARRVVVRRLGAAVRRVVVARVADCVRAVN